MQKKNFSQGSIAGFLVGVWVLMFLFGCGEKSIMGPKAMPVLGAPAKSASVIAPVLNSVFVSYVVCGAEFPDGQRYSHMLRITAALDIIEFTGSLGQRVFVTQTESIDLSAGLFLASFAGNAGVVAFDLSIDRSSLDYVLNYNAERTGTRVSIEGKCNLLEGNAFML